MIAATRADAVALDATDPLGGLRAAFDLPAGLIYLDGNSLGPPPLSAINRLSNTAAEEWKNGLIRSWNDADWIELPKRAGEKIARIIGVGADDVIVADSVSVNIFKLAGALWRTRNLPLAFEPDEFPTDGYVIQGLSALTGAALRCNNIDPFADGPCILVKSAVHYKTAAIADIRAWEKRAADAGASIVWDLSHAAGLIELNLDENGAAFAVGCGYKFLNGGPGAPAFIYVHSDHADTLRQPLSGWMGHHSPFEFAPDYTPAPGVARFACGTPPILSLSALDAALDVFTTVDLADVEAKARRLGDLFLEQTNMPGLELVSPANEKKRGGHASLAHDNGFEIIQALIARGVIGDFRPPSLMRFGFSPLYLRYADIWDAAAHVREILQNEEWRNPRFSIRGKVT